jgi:hypothetical protein
LGAGERSAAALAEVARDEPPEQGGKIGFYGATPVVQPSGADQPIVTLSNTDGEIGGLAISDPPTQTELQALRDKCEELADDVRALSALVHALRGALVAVGVVKLGRREEVLSKLTASCRRT